MGFRINQNSIMSIDGIPYMWNYGHVPEPDQPWFAEGTYNAKVNGNYTWAIPIMHDISIGSIGNQKWFSSENLTIEGMVIFNNVGGAYSPYGGFALFYNGNGRDYNGLVYPQGSYYSEFFSKIRYPAGIRELITFQRTLIPVLSNTTSNGTRFGYSVAAGSGIVAVGEPRYSALYGSYSDEQAVGSPVTTAANRVLTISAGRVRVYNLENQLIATLVNYTTLNGTDLSGIVSSVVTNGTSTITINFTSSHGATSGRYISIEGFIGNSSEQRKLNGIWRITVVNSTQVTFTHNEGVDGGTMSGALFSANMMRLLDASTSSGIEGVSRGGHLFVGSSLAVSDNGAIVAGGESSSPLSRDSDGVVFVYRKDDISTSSPNSVQVNEGFNVPTVFPHKMIGPNSIDGAVSRFGASVAVLRSSAYAYNGNKLFVGAPGSTSNTGNVWVYNLDNLLTSSTVDTYPQPQTVLGTITPTTDHTYSGGAPRFGESMAAADGIIAIGAPDYTIKGKKVGAVYLYKHIGTQRYLEKVITPPFTNDYTPFLTSYAGNNGQTTVIAYMSTADVPQVGDLIQIKGYPPGTPSAPPGSPATINGTWVVTARGTSTPLIQFVIDSPWSSTGTFAVNGDDGSIRSMRTFSDVGQTGIQFGASIAVGSGRIAISAPGQGKVYLYDYDGNLINTLSNPSSSGTRANGMPISEFGRGLAIGNGKIFVGSPSESGWTQGFAQNSNYVTNDRGFANLDYAELITGRIVMYTLDGSLINQGYRDMDEQDTGGTRLYRSYYRTNWPYITSNYVESGPGLGWAMNVYNDTLYVSGWGIGNGGARLGGQGDVNVYKNITRTNTISDAVSYQRGLK